MGKKIVVITGSPRKDGNTFRMAEAFIKAAEEKGNTVARFDAAFLEMGGCKSCGFCYQGGKPCCAGNIEKTDGCERAAGLGATIR